MLGRNKKKAAGLFLLLQPNQLPNDGMASDGQSDSSGDCRALVLPADMVIRSPEVLAEQRDAPFFRKTYNLASFDARLTTLSPIPTLST